MSKFTDEIDDFLVENRLCYENEKDYGNDGQYRSFYICGFRAKFYVYIFANFRFIKLFLAKF